MHLPKEKAAVPVLGSMPSYQAQKTQPNPLCQHSVDESKSAAGMDALLMAIAQFESLAAVGGN